jgi:thiamine pyrophosphokinase
MLDLNYIISSGGYDLIVLNRPGLSSLYKELFSLSALKILTDGAAVRLKEELLEAFSDYMPTMIIGDFDSCSQEGDYAGIEVIRADDQDYTDLDKALDMSKNETVVILTDFGGRLDHTLGAFNSILNEKHSSKKIFLYNRQNIAFFIHTEATFRASSWKYCGIFPLSGKTLINTSGFTWDMKNKETYFGGLVSFCNTLDREGSISTNKPVLLVFSNDSED